jgi:hypothetical protein
MGQGRGRTCCQARRIVEFIRGEEVIGSSRKFRNILYPVHRR